MYMLLHQKTFILYSEVSLAVGVREIVRWGPYVWGPNRVESI